MDPAAVLLGLLVPGAAAAVAVLADAGGRSERRQLRHTPRSAIAGAVDGQLVKVVGRVRYADFTVATPGGRTCCYWRARGESEARSFLVDDGSGLAYVHADGMLVLDRGREVALVEGQRVAVRGVTRWLDRIEPSPRAPAGKLLVLHACQGLPLLVASE